jgi:hypothetical protein
MEEATPYSTLKAALEEWRAWPPELGLQAAPEIISPLGEGSSNHCHLVDWGGRMAVARVRAPKVDALNLSADVEWLSHHRAWRQGIAPEPLYYNKAQRLFVSHYQFPDAGDSIDTPEAIARLLHEIHNLDGVDHVLDHSERLATYRARCSPSLQNVAAELDSLEPQLSAVREETQALCPESRLCHNDLLTANRLPTRDGVLALDWEYAAMGDPYFDLAVVCQGDNLRAESKFRLLAEYGPDNENTRRRLVLNELCYAHLELLWMMATDNCGEATAVAMLAKLLDRLEQT